MRNPIAELLESQAVIVLDGGLATELERRGADLRDPLWSAKCLVEQPELIRSVHLEYFEAGADIATTATYQASFEAFAARGVEETAAERLMRDSVRLAAEAREEFWSNQRNRLGRARPLIAASIGPYGAMLADGSEYRGHYTIDDAGLANFYRARLAVLADSGADLLAFETFPCVREAKIVAQLLLHFPQMCAWVSFSCRDAERNSEGEDIGACVAQLQDHPQIAAVGVNCTRIEFVEPLVTRMRGCTDKPIVVYPNSGESYDASAKTWTGLSHSRTDLSHSRTDLSHSGTGVAHSRLAHSGTSAAHSQEFGTQARAWYHAGVRLIGGCCRTTPADIRAVKCCV